MTQNLSIEAGLIHLNEVSISVCIPTYNCSSYLKKTLESIHNQAPGNYRLSVKVIDDGSVDDVNNVVDKYPNVALIDYGLNVGAIQNFNRCILACDSDYLHILHGDDYVEHNFYAEMSAVILQSPQIGIYYSNCCVVNENDEKIGEENHIASMNKETINNSYFLLSNQIRTPTVVVSMNAYRKVGCFDAAFPHLADWQMWIKCISSTGGIRVTSTAAYYRVHSLNDTSKMVRSGQNITERDSFKRWLQTARYTFDVHEYDQLTILQAMGQITDLAIRGHIDFAWANVDALLPILREVDSQTRLKVYIRLLKLSLKVCLKPVFKLIR